MEPTVMITLGGMALTGVVWAVRQEGRISTLKQQRADDQKLYLERHTDIKHDIKKVETKLDDLADYLLRELPRAGAR